MHMTNINQIVAQHDYTGNRGLSPVPISQIVSHFNQFSLNSPYSVYIRMSSKAKGGKGKTKGKGKGDGSNARNGKGNTKPVGGGVRQNPKRFEFADASKFATAVTTLQNDIVSDSDVSKGQVPNETKEPPNFLLCYLTKYANIRPTNLRFARAMHNAWIKHLVVRQVIVDGRIAAHEGAGDDGYDGNTGESPLQRAEDALYNANLTSYNTLIQIFNEKYPTLQGQYTEEAPTKNTLGEQVENLREQITTMQTGLANFQCVEYMNITFSINLCFESKKSGNRPWHNLLTLLPAMQTATMTKMAQINAKKWGISNPQPNSR